MKKNSCVTWRCQKKPHLRKIWMTMKLTMVLFFLAITNLMATETYSQATKLTLQVKDATVREVLSKIEENSEFFFLYNGKLVDVDRKISIDVNDQKINEILSNMFEGTDVVYAVVDRQIVLTNKANQNGFVQPDSQQSQKITGSVIDKNGPIPGANVVITGTTQGTITDIAGKYSIEVPQGSKSLTFSFVGMQPQEITIGTLTQINVTMTESAIGLQEVVVIGYGTQKKVNLTGAISTVNSSVIEGRPIASIAEGLQGAIPNLNINFSSGDPTQDKANYNLRGFESINGGHPYTLVDGVPMNIEQINPGDIESITVLKDASASAIYGGQAAFGVILVTTKQGEGKDKIKVHYSHETALSSPIFKGFDAVTNSFDHVTLKNLTRTNDGLTPDYNNIMVAGVTAYYKNPKSSPEYAIENGNFYFYGYTNFKDELLNTFAPSNKNDLSVSGGTKKSNFYVSFGNFTKEGNLKIGNDSYNRNNILVKLNQNIADWISLDEKITLNMVKTNKPHDYGQFQNVSSITLTPPTQAIKFPENDPDFPDLGGYYFENGAGYMDKGGRTTERSYDTWLTSGINLKPVKNLNIRSEISYNYYNSVYNDAIATVDFVKTQGLGLGSNFTNGFTSPSSATASARYRRDYIFNTYAEYELKDLGKHYIKALVGFNQEEAVNSGVLATGNELITPYVPSVNASIGQRIGGVTSSNYGLMGTFYRLNYIYNNKYLFELSGRYDGTSRFPKKDRFGFFPSGSLGWRVSEEGFMKGLAWIDNLKVRASYGSLGNQQISYNGEDLLYPYIASLGVISSNWLTLNSTSYPLHTTIPALVSSSLTWETVATKDMGIDFTLFKQKLDGSFDYYIRSTTNMLMRKQYPDMLGATPPYENAASLDTKGWEFTLSWHDKITTDLSYGLKFALWDSKTTITKYDNPTGSLSTYYKGQVLGEIWGYQTKGLYQSQAEIDNGPDQSALSGGTWYPGDVNYTDLNNDGKINIGNNTLNDHGDLKIIGNNMPRYSYSFNIDLKYKNWSLSVFFQGIGKRDYMPNANFGIWYPWDLNGVIKTTDLKDSWTPDNPNAYWYRPESVNAQEKNRQSQTRWMQNAAYLRLKSVVLSYSLPSVLIKKVGLSDAQVFISGQNLWEHSNFIYGRDPEQNTGNNLTINDSFFGPSRVSYPFQRTVSLGVNLTF